MRFYSIVITDPESGNVIIPDPATRIFKPVKGALATYTSWVNNQSLPGALNVELDIPVAPFATPVGAAYVRVWGVSLQEIGQASNLNGKPVSIYAGMQKGLPLANPAQSGLLIQGFVQQGFGNWQGTEQSIDLIIQAGIGTNAAPKNFTLSWKAGTNLSDAIKATFATALPDYSINVNINPNLVLSNDEDGFYSTIEQFAEYIKAISQHVVGGTYQGVDIAIVRGKSISVYDGTTQATPKVIVFTDLVGQPTWVDPGTIQVRCVMRADISIGDYLKLPPGVVTTTAQSLSQYRQGSVFQGTFAVKLLRSNGNFRQPDGSSWVTTIDAYPVTKAA